VRLGQYSSYTLILQSIFLSGNNFPSRFNTQRNPFDAPKSMRSPLCLYRRILTQVSASVTDAVRPSKRLEWIAYPNGCYKRMHKGN
jgi:hypothetical protein